MKKITSLLFAFILTCSFTLFAYADTQHPARVVDNAGVLTDSEFEALTTKLDEISERQSFDVAVVIVNSLNGASAQDYADDYYDYNGYGIGSNYDGVLLLVSMDERCWYVKTTGYGEKAVTDAGRDYMSDKFLPYLSDGEYYKSFEIFAELCDDFVTQAKDGQPYDVGDMPREKLSLLWIPGSLLIGAVIALIILLVMWAQLKSVRQKNTASDYTKNGSMSVTVSRDIFLFSKVDKRAKPQNNSSGGGSRTHTSSSGRSHGGGGGRF